jgi:8-oxo-dGTP diphosphatase
MGLKTPKLTVDAVIIRKDEVLLIKRKNPPFRNSWALPGGFVNYGEKTEMAVKRELKEETGIQMKIIRLIGVYSDPDRDPRGHTISIVYQGSWEKGDLIAGDDASEAQFFKLNRLPKLAFDHIKIINDVMRSDS